MSTMTKERKQKAKTNLPQANPVSLSGERMRLAPANLSRHPDNRQPNQASIDAVAASLATEGQIEPVLVRRLGEFTATSTYQIISGETRCLAARKLGWDSIACEVADLDDAAALRVLASANAARQDLDPIAKARLIVRLCDPLESGGSGLTREAAAKMFDLQSGGAASNLVRLLELPKLWVDRVASGELPQSFARELLPLLDLGEDSEAWAELEEDWPPEEDDQYAAFSSRSKLGLAVDHLLVRHSRPVEKSDKRQYDREGLGWEQHPLRFRLTTELEEELRIVRLTIGAVPQRRATNCQLYDSLQVPAIKAWLAKKSKGKSGADEPSKSDEKLSPKQQEAADAERREKATEQLAKRIERWRAHWLRELVAVAIVEDDNADLAIRLVAWQQRQVRVISYGDANNLALDEALASIWKVKDPWQGVLRLKDQGGVEQLVAHWLRCPVRDGYEHPMPDDKVEDLVELLKIDLADRWLVMQSGANDPERFASFFELHNSEQLDSLGTELGVFVNDAKTKALKVRKFVSRERILKLPKSLKPLRGRKGGGS